MHSCPLSLNYIADRFLTNLIAEMLIVSLKFNYQIAIIMDNEASIISFVIDCNLRLCGVTYVCGKTYDSAV